MILKIVFLILNIYPSPTCDQAKDYTFIFEKVDNRVEILVNDSIIYDSGTINDPHSFSGKKISIGPYLKHANNKVVVRLYNGYEPYENQIDRSWQIKYALMEGTDEYENYWEKGRDYRVGLVLEEAYYL
ncbi:hypothetical protein [Ekhidna sp.]|uniref:hypothetical protein n=1 Tax=Ekhidna sp. TaxID=2608089 RepID=UPI003B5123AA